MAEQLSAKQKAKLLDLARDLEKGIRRLSDEEQRTYWEKRRTILEARRKAELQEGLLQLQ